MKKVMLLASVIGLSLVLQSFSKGNTADQVSFNTLESSEEIKLLAEVGTFEEAQESKNDEDKGTWNYRYKKWTLNSDQASMSDMEEILIRN
jgi:hypothetical protein